MINGLFTPGEKMNRCCDCSGSKHVFGEGVSSSNEKPAADYVVLAKKISRLGLAIFAFLLDPKICLIYGGIGVVSGMTYRIVRTIRKEEIEIGEAGPQCGKGWWEEYSGIKLPPLVGELGTFIFIAGHMKQCRFYVRYMAIPLGAYVGDHMIRMGCLLYRKIVSIWT